MTFGLCLPQLSFIQSSNHPSGPCVCIFSPTMSSEEQQSTSVESEAVPEKDESPETSSDESDSPESHPKSSPPSPSSVTDPTPGPSSQSGLKAKKEERMKRLRELHLRRVRCLCLPYVVHLPCVRTYMCYVRSIFWPAMCYVRWVCLGHVLVENND